MPQISILKGDDNRIKISTFGANDRMVVESMVSLFNAYYRTHINVNDLSYDNIQMIDDLIGFAARSVEDAIEAQEVEVEPEVEPEPESETTQKDWDEFWQSPDSVEYMTLGQWLKQRRTSFGATQKDMAALIGISQVYYVKLELGYVNYPSMKVVRLIEEVLGEIPPHVVFHKSL